MVIKKLREYLDANNIKYVVISHSPAFSAQEVAALVHIPGREMAKTVMVNVRGNLAMAVLPASFNIDFNRLSIAMGTGDVYLATEGEFKERFPDCEVGAMSPFGNLYDIDVYVAESLAEDDEIGPVFAHLGFDGGQGPSPRHCFMDDEDPPSSGLKHPQRRESARRQMRVHVSGDGRYGRDRLQLDGHFLRPQVPGVKDVVDPLEDLKHFGIQEPMGIRQDPQDRGRLDFGHGLRPLDRVIPRVG